MGPGWGRAWHCFVRFPALSLWMLQHLYKSCYRLLCCGCIEVILQSVLIQRDSSTRYFWSNVLKCPSRQPAGVHLVTWCTWGPVQFIIWNYVKICESNGKCSNRYVGKRKQFPLWLRLFSGYLNYLRLWCSGVRRINLVPCPWFNCIST